MPYYRRNLYVLWLASFFTAGSWTQILPFLPLYIKDLGVTDNVAQWSGLVFSIHFFSAVFMQPVWGKVADRFGRKPMLIRAGVSVSAVYLLMSLATHPWQLVVLRFLNGAFSGFIPMAVALVATNTPKELSGRYVASTQTAAAAGQIVGPATGGVLAGLFGYRGALQASAILVVISTILTIIVVQERNKARETERTSLVQDVGAALKMPPLVTVMGTVLLAMVMVTAIQPVLTLYLAELNGGGSQWLSGLVFSLPGLAFVIFAGRWTRLGEKLGYQTLIPLGLVGGGLITMVLTTVHAAWQFALGYFIMGVFLAVLRPCAAALIATEVESRFRGRAYGIQQSAGMIGGVVAPLVAGLIGDYWGTRFIFAWVGVILLLGAVLMQYQIAVWSPLPRLMQHLRAPRPKGVSR